MTQGSPNSGRRADIQGLRAIAVLLVVAYHAGIGLDGGFIGVDVFFVISGYVITRVLVAEAEREGRVDLKRFYLRRMRRLLPALGVMLAVVMAASAALSPFGGMRFAARTGLGAVFLNANTYLVRQEVGYFDPAIELNALLHTWSLSVEEQFYLFYPLVLILAWRLGRATPRSTPRTALGVSLASLIAASFALSVYYAYGHGGARELLAFYSAPTRAWEFAAGALLVIASPLAARLPALVATALSGAGLALIAAASVTYDPTITFPGIAALLPVAGTAMVIAGGERFEGGLNGLLGSEPLQRLGDLSYSWYLWHWPAIVLGAAITPGSRTMVAAMAVLSLIPAMLSHRFVEQPIRSDTRTGARRTLTIAGAFVALPLVAGVGLSATYELIERSDVMQPFAFHADVEAGCDSEMPLGSRADSDCTWAGSEGAPHAVLIGDSQAGHLTEAVVQGLGAEGYTVTVATRSACPFVDVELAEHGSVDQGCRRFVTRSVEDLVELAPDLVVIASASDVYITGYQYEVRDPDGHSFSEPQQKAEAWVGGLTRVIDAVGETGSDVMVVHPTPKLRGWDPRTCATMFWFVDPGRCSSSGFSAELDSERQLALESEQLAVALTGAGSLDLFDDICPEAECATNDGGEWRWRDGGHISVSQSVRLSPVFARVGRELGS